MFFIPFTACKAFISNAWRRGEKFSLFLSPSDLLPGPDVRAGFRFFQKGREKPGVPAGPDVWAVWNWLCYLKQRSLSRQIYKTIGVMVCYNYVSGDGKMIHIDNVFSYSFMQFEGECIRKLLLAYALVLQRNGLPHSWKYQGVPSRGILKH